MSTGWHSPQWKTADPPVSPRKGRRTYDISQESPNGRATCVRCNHKIEKGQQRVGIQCKRDIGRKFDKWTPKYYHASCISENCKRKLVFKNEKPRKKMKVDTAVNTTTASGDRKSLLSAKKCTELRQDLRQMRSLLAIEHLIPSDEEYRVFPSKSLDDILDRLPTNLDELKECWGIKDKRAAYYGEAILQIVGKYLDQKTLDNLPASHRQNEEKSSDDEVVFVKELSVEEIVSNRVKELKASGQFEEIDL